MIKVVPILQRQSAIVCVTVVSTWYLLPYSLPFMMILSSIVCLNQSTVKVLHIPIASQPMVANPPSIILQVELAGTLI